MNRMINGVVVPGAISHPHWLVRVLRATVRLFVPVAAYLLSLAAAWQLLAMPIDFLDTFAADKAAFNPSTWLTWGHAMLAVAFLLNSLVNRRYGLDYAIAHTLVSWAVLACLVLSSVARLDPRLPMIDLPDPRMIGAFAAAMIVSHIFSAVVFDRTRGALWWTAPLYAGLAAALVFVGIFYPMAQPGGEGLWLNRLAVDAGVKAGMAFALLVPYFILRPVVRPMPGFGGF